MACARARRLVGCEGVALASRPFWRSSLKVLTRRKQARTKYRPTSAESPSTRNSSLRGGGWVEPRCWSNRSALASGAPSLSSLLQGRHLCMHSHTTAGVHELVGWPGGCAARARVRVGPAPRASWRGGGGFSDRQDAGSCSPGGVERQSQTRRAAALILWVLRLIYAISARPRVTQS